MFRRLITLAAAVTPLVAALAAPALAERVKVRVEGKTTTIFGSTEPSLTTGPNALAVLDAASLVGEFYYHVSPGPFVNQIGRYPGLLQRLELQDQRSLPAGRGGSGPGQGRRHGALVLGDVQRAGNADAAPRRGAKANCYSVVSQDDWPRRRSNSVLVVDGRRGEARRTACVGRHRGLVRATAPNTVRSNALR